MSDLKNWADNADLNVANSPDGWPEGMPPSDVNNSAREMMAALRRSYVRQPWYAPGGAITRVSATTITIADDSKVTDYSSYYSVGARVRVETTDNYVTGFISGSLYEAPTSTITFTLDAGAELPATITDVYVGLSPEDVQGVAGPNLLGCVIGFTEEGTKVGAGLLLANGSKFNPSLYPDLAQLYYVSENTYRYGQELVGDVYWPKLPDVRGYFPRYADDRTAPEGGDPDTRIDPSAPRTVGSTQGDAIRNLVGRFKSIDREYGGTSGIFSVESRWSTNIHAGGDDQWGTNIKEDASTQVPTAEENRPKNIAMVGVVVAYGGVISAGLADVSELEEYCTAERVRAKEYADDAEVSASDASDSATAASGSATLAQQWATKMDGQVASTDYSAKYYAGQSSTSASSASSSADLAHAWATSSTVVESGQYGASYYALRAANYAISAETARDTARNWATKTDGPVADSSYSAKFNANLASTSATTAQNWATKTDGPVSGGNYSAKYYATQSAASAAEAADIVASIGTVMRYKGSVATYEDLPSTGNTVGDVYNVTSTGKNYAWTNDNMWDDFSGAITISIAAATDVSLNDLANGQVLIYNSVSGKWENGVLDTLPSQTGNTGKFLTTDGTNASWSDVPNTLPSQTGNTGKFLTTDGTNASWAAVPDALPNQVGNAGKALYTDGQNASWEVTRDPNTYRTLSAAQEAQLLVDGTYNGEAATSGEIFTAEDGTFKEYTDTVTFEGVTMLDYKLRSTSSINGGKFKNWAWVTMGTGDGGVFSITKDNGLTWTETSPSGTFPGYNYKGYGLTDDTTLYFLKGGYNGNFGQKTTDGINFTQFTCPANTPAVGSINSGYCGSKFIVNKYTHSSGGYVYSDDPSVSWTVGAYPTGVTAALMMIFSDSVYLIDEDTKRVYKTVPGEGFLTSWTDTGYNSDTTRDLTQGTYSDGLCVVNDMAFWTSRTASGRNLEYSLDNGITWTQTSYPIYNVYYCKDTQTYIGLLWNNTTTYYMSSDGINWQQKTVEAGKTLYINIAAYNDNCVITLSNSASSRINTEASHNFSVDALSYNKTGVDTLVSGVAPIVGNAAPTSSDAGSIGQLWIYSGSVYICTGVSGSTYTWKQITTS